MWRHLCNDIYYLIFRKAIPSGTYIFHYVDVVVVYLLAVTIVVEQYEVIIIPITTDNDNNRI